MIALATTSLTNAGFNHWDKKLRAQLRRHDTGRLFGEVRAAQPHPSAGMQLLHMPLCNSAKANDRGGIACLADELRRQLGQRAP